MGLNGQDGAGPDPFGLDRAAVATRPALPGLFVDTWRDLGSAGAAWSGAERVAIAAAARSARGRGTAAPSSLSGPAAEAAERVSGRPSSLSKSYVESTVAQLGETAYVELVGIVSTLSAVDAFTQLVGAGVAALPTPTPGDPHPTGDIADLKRRSAWVSMAGPPRPRSSLSAAPGVQTTFNRILDTMYMTREQLHSAEPVRELGRTQMELAILGVSHANECFY